MVRKSDGEGEREDGLGEESEKSTRKLGSMEHSRTMRKRSGKNRLILGKSIDADGGRISRISHVRPLSFFTFSSPTRTSLSHPLIHLTSLSLPFPCTNPSQRNAPSPQRQDNVCLKHMHHNLFPRRLTSPRHPLSSHSLSLVFSPQLSIHLFAFAHHGRTDTLG